MTAKYLTLFVALMVLTGTGNAMAQSLDPKGTWQFGAGGNTIAGPGETTRCAEEDINGKLIGVWETSLQANMAVCATVTNLGDTEILMSLDGTAGGTTSKVPPGKHERYVGKLSISLPS